MWVTTQGLDKSFSTKGRRKPHQQSVWLASIAQCPSLSSSSSFAHQRMAGGKNHVLLNYLPERLTPNASAKCKLSLFNQKDGGRWQEMHHLLFAFG
jgi:hypothetical protein